MKGVRPAHFVEKNLSGYPLYSVVTGKRVIEIEEKDFRSYHFRKIRYNRWKKETKKKVKATMRSWVSSA